MFVGSNGNLGAKAPRSDLASQGNLAVNCATKLRHSRRNHAVNLLL
jgi:hypothetical protein